MLLIRGPKETRATQVRGARRVSKDRLDRLVHRDLVASVESVEPMAFRAKMDREDHRARLDPPDHRAFREKPDPLDPKERQVV